MRTMGTSEFGPFGYRAVFSSVQLRRPSRCGAINGGHVCDLMTSSDLVITVVGFVVNIPPMTALLLALIAARKQTTCHLSGPTGFRPTSGSDI